MARRAATATWRGTSAAWRGAVGIACGSNPIAIVIPCHRVIGAGGRMVGYSGGKGVRTKSWLLVHEGWRPPRDDPAQLSLFGAPQ